MDHKPDRDEIERVEAELWRLALPAMAQGLLFTVVFTVDTLMVARLGEQAIAAVGAASPVVWSISSLLFAMSRATTALVASGVGAGRLEDARKAAGQSILLAAMLGIFSAVLFVVLPEAILAPFALAPDVSGPAAAYLAIVGASLVFSLPHNVFAATLQAGGDTRTPLLVSVVGNAVNIAGDYVLIFGAFGLPALGVRGAAAATALCRLVECLLLGWILFRHDELGPRARQVTVPDPSAIRTIARVAMPAVAEAASFHLGYLVFSCLVARLGTTALAAHRICLSIEALAFMPASGMAVAAATHTGQCVGAGREDLAQLGIDCIRRRARLFMALTAAVLLAIPSAIVSLYTVEPAVHSLAAACLRISGTELVPLGTAMVLMGAMQGAGDTRSPFIVTTASIWLLRIPLTWLLGFTLGLGLAGVWTATALDWTGRAWLDDVAVARGRWKKALSLAIDR